MTGKGVVLLVLSLGWALSASAQEVWPSQITNFIGKEVAVFDKDFNRVGTIIPANVPQADMVVLRTENQMYVIMHEGEERYIDVNAATLANAPPVVKPPCSKITQVAQSQRSQQRGEMGLGSVDQMCEQKGGKQ